MHITLILSILLNMLVVTSVAFYLNILTLFCDSGICIYYWITKYYCTPSFPDIILAGLTVPTAGAIIFTVIALLSILSYFGYRSRIPLASLLLQVVMDVAKHHPSVYFVAFMALFLQAALSVYVSSHISISHYSRYVLRFFVFTAIAT